MRFVRSGDRGLLVLFGDAPPDRAVQACAARLLSDGPPGLVSVHPGQGNLLVEFDPLRSTHDAMRQAVVEVEATLERGGVDLRPPRRIEIPVCYESGHAPDLDEVAAWVGLSPREVVARHAAAVYRVEFLGFVPGFAYLAGLPESLAVPRRAEPRRSVPAGSVAIGGSRTAVYPFATPGGWRLIGRTPRRLYDPAREPRGLLEAGDEVRFVPISSSRYDEEAP